MQIGIVAYLHSIYFKVSRHKSQPVSNAKSSMLSVPFSCIAIALPNFIHHLIFISERKDSAFPQDYKGFFTKMCSRYTFIPKRLVIWIISGIFAVHKRF